MLKKTSQVLSRIKTELIKFLKGAAIKAALKQLLGSAAMGGIKGWLIKFVVTELFEEVAEPLIKMALNHVGYIYDKQRGRVVIKRLERAENEGDEDGYNSASDDVFRN